MVVELLEREGEGSHLVVDGPWTDDVTSTWVRAGKPSVGYSSPGGNLDFVSTLEGLERFIAVGVFSDHSGVARSTSLKSLTLRTSVPNGQRLDLSMLQRLETLETEDNLIEESLHRLPISSLRYVEWPWPSLSAVARCRKLTDLYLESPRGLKSLTFGDDEVPPLEVLAITYSRRSIDLAPLSTVCATLRELELSSVKVSDYSPIRDLTNLASLFIEGGKIPDLEFLRGHPSLKSVVIAGNAVVLSNDLSPLDDLPFVEVRYVRPRTSYNRAYDHLPAEDT